MARWTDIADWRGPTPNHGGKMVEQRGVVEHTAVGTFEGTIAWCRNPASDVSCHFVVAKDGRIAQMVDTDIAAWTQRVGNGHWLSVENEGYPNQALTDAQIEASAKILAKAHQVYGVPLQLATSPAGKGLGHHSMGPENGVNWGHSECPGPLIKAQKPAILARAVQLVRGPMGGEDMIFAISDGPRKGYAGRAGGGCYQFGADNAQLERWRADQGGVPTVWVAEADFADRVGIVDTGVLAAMAPGPTSGITEAQARAIFDEELADVTLTPGN